MISTNKTIKPCRRIERDAHFRRSCGFFPDDMGRLENRDSSAAFLLTVV